MEDPIIKILKKSMIKQHEERDNPHAERNFWYASNLGKCLRGAYFQRKGEQPTRPVTEESAISMDLGHEREEWFREKLSQAGVIIATQLFVQDPKTNGAGHVDMIARVTGNIFVLEIKSVNTYAFQWIKKLQKPNEQHVQQTTFYLSRVKADHYPNVKMAKIIYSDRGSGEMFAFNIFLDPKVIKAIRDQFKTLNNCWGNNTLPPLPMPVVKTQKKTNPWQKNWQASYCPFHALCTGDPDWELKAELEVKRLNKEGGEPRSELLKVNEPIQIYKRSYASRK